MNNCALICEYNPFHTGHAYQLGRIRESGADNIVCVMSGNFTQNGLPAFCDKALRAECAVLGGSDAVIELPTVYATASAGYFAEGALKIISNIKDIKTLAMGVTAEPDVISKLADIKITHADEFAAERSAQMSSGKSYNAANTNALCALFEKKYGGNFNISDTIADPNNMLAIEYIVAIAKYAANIEPLLIKRRGAAHGDKGLDSEYASATAIRDAFENGSYDRALAFLPFAGDAVLQYRQAHAPDIRAFKKLAAYSLKAMPLDKISTLRDCSESMEYLINKIKSNDYDTIVSATECKRYGKKRVARLLLDAALGIESRLLTRKFITRLLAKKSGFDVSILPSCVKLRNSDIKLAATDPEIYSVLSVDERAAVLYNTISSADGNYYNFGTVTI